MVLTSIIFFRALPVHPDPEIRISGSRHPFFWIFRSRPICRAPEKPYLPKPYMGPIFCYWHILIQPLLLGAPLIDIVPSNEVIPDFRIRMNRSGSQKNYIYIKPHISYNWCFIKNFLRPLLLGAPLVNLS